MKRIALTPGEPAGIGPDLAVLTAQSIRDYELVVIGDAAVIIERAAQLNLPINIRAFEPDSEPLADGAHTLCVYQHDVAADVVAGELNPANASYVLATLKTAAIGCLENTFDAMVTAPVHKGVINDAGIEFTGHTEYLAEITQASPVMMLASNNPQIRVALATTHLPLKDVSTAISKESLSKVLHILNDDLKKHFGIASPRILVCGLNPHAGEGGHLGREEIDVIEPALEQLRSEGIDLQGPLPADTLFTEHHLKDCDAVLAMFHDQGLPVLKYASFGHAINVTLGLPIIRTSVDHGTALDKAGSGKIDQGSLNEALALALELSHYSKNSNS